MSLSRPESESARSRRRRPCAARRAVRTRAWRPGGRGHAHVDADRRALLHAERLQPVGHANDLVEQRLIGDRRAVALRLALEMERDLLARGLHMPVEAVEADVELAADEPLRVRLFPLEHRVEVLEPRHALACLACPELLERDVIDPRLRGRLRCELGRRRVAPLLREQGLDRLVHGRDPNRRAWRVWRNGARRRGTLEVVMQGRREPAYYQYVGDRGRCSAASSVFRQLDTRRPSPSRLDPRSCEAASRPATAARSCS